MSAARVLDGVKAAAAALEGVRDRVAGLAARGVKPGVAIVQVGHVTASDVYVTRKLEAAAGLGLAARKVAVDESQGYGILIGAIEALNADPSVHGYLVQLPLPTGWDEARALRGVTPEKDLDGFHPINIGLATLGEGGFWPCTPLGVLELLRHHEVPVSGRHVVIVGRSRVVGRPLATLLSQRGVDGTVTLCHSASGDFGRYTRDADVVVMAAGVAGCLTGAMIREGAVVVDVGIHRVPDPARPGKHRLVGDVDAASVAPRAAWLSPVPGGVGPMTVAKLMRNAVTACERGLA